MIIASIDIMNHKAVQLKQGKEKVLEVVDVQGLARRFHPYGEIAVIDLDEALGSGSNKETVLSLLPLADCRVGGGIRSAKIAKEWISRGAAKVIVGTAAFTDHAVNHSFLREINEAIGKNRLIVAIDSLEEEIVIRGWKERTGIPLLTAARELETYCGELLFTCVEREGTMQGIDMAIVEKLARSTNLKLTVAGGVASLSEISALARLGMDVQLGMALYTGKIDLALGFADSLKWKSELIPTMVRDEDGVVRMLAYSNHESLRRSFAEGRMWYFSRSRQKLWMKGETSGNIQELVAIRADCDQDTLLATVRQKGPSCHSGRETCFGEKPFRLQELERVIRDRMANPRPGSYTASLTLEKTREKLLEEVREIVEAIKKEEIIWEAADVFYFLLVYLARQGIPLSSVERELFRRRWA